MQDKADIFGRALKNHYSGKRGDDLYICGDDLEDEIMDLSYYFRTYNKMPEIEQKALELCRGSVLDIGAGAGSHSLYLQEQGYKVKGIDISEGAVEVMKQRGLKNYACCDVQDIENEKFDTLLLMMNGVGISGKLAALPAFISHLLGLLETGGQIIFDSTDLRYLYEDDDGGMWMDLNAEYYGEMNYSYRFKGEMGKGFAWLYVDEEKMRFVCKQLGLKMEVVFRADDYHYLLHLTRLAD
jgi:SAM-dependent methyltransferase